MVGLRGVSAHFISEVMDAAIDRSWKCQFDQEGATAEGCAPLSKVVEELV